MLKEIRCDKFAKTHNPIKFESGLNTVMGSSGGSNAIGKSTFLWIVDYAFGGEHYCVQSSDILKEMGNHAIYFTFEFDGKPQYFYRSTDDRKHVCRCDKDGHLIDKLSLEDYCKHLYREYHVDLPFLTFPDLAERFFRIYGRENILEKYPLRMKMRESDESSIDFLLKLFGHYSVTKSIKAMEEELGIKVSQLKTKRSFVDTEKIEANEKAIAEMMKRLKVLMDSSAEAQLTELGFDTQMFERVNIARKELTSINRKRNRLVSQLNAIESNTSGRSAETTAEFESLLRFFPDTNLRTLNEIEHFHKKIAEILGEEMSQEIERLRPLITHYDKEIERLRKKIEESGLAREMSERTLAQCVSVSKRIDELQVETDELVHQKDLQEQRVLAERQLEALFKQQSEKIESIQDDITFRMATINSAVTDKQEISPLLEISPYKEIKFETPGNTSEGTAYKSLVIYDLSVLELRPIPALIHDSNILKRIEDAHLRHILERYQNSGRQIFIAFDKADSITDNAREILKRTTVLTLKDGDELFGKSWSKHEATE